MRQTPKVFSIEIKSTFEKPLVYFLRLFLHNIVSVSPELSRLGKSGSIREEAGTASTSKSLERMLSRLKPVPHSISLWLTVFDSHNDCYTLHHSAHMKLLEKVIDEFAGSGLIPRQDLTAERPIRYFAFIDAGSKKISLVTFHLEIQA